MQTRDRSAETSPSLQRLPALIHEAINLHQRFATEFGSGSSSAPPWWESLEVARGINSTHSSIGASLMKAILDGEGHDAVHLLSEVVKFSDDRVARHAPFGQLALPLVERVSHGESQPVGVAAEEVSQDDPLLPEQNEQAAPSHQASAIEQASATKPARVSPFQTIDRDLPVRPSQAPLAAVQVETETKKAPVDSAASLAKKQRAERRLGRNARRTPSPKGAKGTACRPDRLSFPEVPQELREATFDSFADLNLLLNFVESSIEPFVNSNAKRRTSKNRQTFLEAMEIIWEVLLASPMKKKIFTHPVYSKVGHLARLVPSIEPERWLQWERTRNKSILLMGGQHNELIEQEIQKFFAFDSIKWIGSQKGKHSRRIDAACESLKQGKYDYVGIMTRAAGHYIPQKLTCVRTAESSWVQLDIDGFSAHAVAVALCRHFKLPNEQTGGFYPQLGYPSLGSSQPKSEFLSPNQGRIERTSAELEEDVPNPTELNFFESGDDPAPDEPLRETMVINAEPYDHSAVFQQIRKTLGLLDWIDPSKFSNKKSRSRALESVKLLGERDLWAHTLPIQFKADLGLHLGCTIQVLSLEIPNEPSLTGLLKEYSSALSQFLTLEKAESREEAVDYATQLQDFRNAWREGLKRYESGESECSEEDCFKILTMIARGQERSISTSEPTAPKRRTTRTSSIFKCFKPSDSIDVFEQAKARSTDGYDGNVFDGANFRPSMSLRKAADLLESALTLNSRDASQSDGLPPPREFREIIDQVPLEPRKILCYAILTWQQSIRPEDQREFDLFQVAPGDPTLNPQEMLHLHNRMQKVSPAVAKRVVHDLILAFRGSRVSLTSTPQFT